MTDLTAEIALRVIDAAVAEKVMGAEEQGCRCPQAPDGYESWTGRCKRCGQWTAPHYTTDWEAAGSVLQRLGESDYCFTITIDSPTNCCVEIGCGSLGNTEVRGATAATFPLAVAMAVLDLISAAPAHPTPQAGQP